MDFKSISDSLAGDFKGVLNNASLEDLKNAVPDISADTITKLIQSIKERAEHLNAGDINNLWDVLKASLTHLVASTPQSATISRQLTDPPTNTMDRLSLLLQTALTTLAILAIAG